MLLVSSNLGVDMCEGMGLIVDTCSSKRVLSGSLVKKEVLLDRPHRLDCDSLKVVYEVVCSLFCEKLSKTRLLEACLKPGEA